MRARRVPTAFRERKKSEVVKLPQPVKKFSAGGVSAAVWENESKDGQVFYSVTLDRRYKDANEEWKSSGSLRQNDLPKAVLVLQKAYEYLVLRDDPPQAADAGAEEKTA